MKAYERDGALEIRRPEGEYIKVCGRYVGWGLWPEIRRQKIDPHSPAVNGMIVANEHERVPVGPDRVLIGGEEVPRVIVAKAGRNRYACLACGTWVCDKCGAKRLYANRRFSGTMSCPKRACRSRKGTWRVGYHTVDRWWTHNDADIVTTGNTGMRTVGVVSE